MEHLWLDVRLTWHDDIRKAQFSCDGHPPAENERVLSADLFHVAPQQLQWDDQTWGEEKEKRRTGEEEGVKSNEDKKRRSEETEKLKLCFSQTAEILIRQN